MARAPKYSRILQAAKLYSAVDNLIKSFTDSTRKGQRVGQGQPRVPSQRLYVDPFAIALANNQVVRQTGALPTWTTYGTGSAPIRTRVTATAPTDEALIIPVANYKAARVVISTGRSNTGVKKVSKVTGLPYLDYGGRSTSLPFGRANETDTMLAAFEEIKAAIIAQTAGARVTLTPEKF